MERGSGQGGAVALAVVLVLASFSPAVVAAESIDTGATPDASPDTPAAGGGDDGNVTYYQAGLVQGDPIDELGLLIGDGLYGDRLIRFVLGSTEDPVTARLPGLPGHRIRRCVDSDRITVDGGAAHVTVTVAAGCEIRLSLVTREKEVPGLPPWLDYEHGPHDSDTRTLTAGTHTLTADLPPGDRDDDDGGGGDDGGEGGEGGDGDDGSDEPDRENRPPRARIAEAPGEPPRGETVAFDANDSTDPDGSIVRYRWDLDGDFSFEREGPSAERAYFDDGRRWVRLEVTDDDGATDTTKAFFDVRRAFAVDPELSALDRKRRAARMLEASMMPHRNTTALASRLRGTFPAFLGPNRVGNASVFHVERHVATKALLHNRSIPRELTAADRVLAAVAVQDARRAAERLDDIDADHDERRVRRALRRAERAFERGLRLERHVPVPAPAIVHYREAWERARSVRRALPPSVAITDRDDPPHDDALNYTVNATVSSSTPEELSVTVKVNGVERNVTVEPGNATGFVAEVNVSVPVTLRNQTNRIVVTASDPGPGEERQTANASLALDGDGLPDRFERNASLTDPLDPDSDSGLTNASEADDGTVDGAEDLDADDLIAYREHRIGTAVDDADTDGDGLRDGFEADLGTDPLDPDSDGDGTTDDREDRDDDLVNLREQRAGTSPLVADTDGDDLNDSVEIDRHDTSPLAVDSDGDGLDDALEAREVPTEPDDPDTDGDGVVDGNETLETTARAPALDTTVTVVGKGDAASGVAIERPRNLSASGLPTPDFLAGDPVAVTSPRPVERATVTMGYDDGRVAPENESRLALYEYHPDRRTFERVAGSRVDVVDDTVSAPRDGFSVFAVLQRDGWQHRLERVDAFYERIDDRRRSCRAATASTLGGFGGISTFSAGDLTADFFYEAADTERPINRGDEVLFRSQASSFDEPITSHHWDFGDGTESTRENPRHTYGSTGEYTVTYTVTDGSGATDSIGRTLTVAGEEPTADFTYVPSDPGPGDEVFFETQASPGDNEIASHEWRFGDGTTATGAAPSHRYAAAGTYTVRYTVTDTAGLSDTATGELTVGDPSGGNTPPDADFTFDPSSPAVGETVDFTERATDSDGDVLTYSWRFGDGATSIRPDPSHSYGSAGSYDVTLTVDDGNGGTDSVTRTVTVGTANEPPQPSFTYAPATPDAGETVTFDAGGSSDPDGTVAGYAWRFPDGSTATGATATHSFANTGDQAVTLTVTDDDGASTATSRVVTVEESVPTYCGDSDGDGIKDYVENRDRVPLAFAPGGPWTHLDPTRADTDDDGLTDAEEISVGEDHRTPLGYVWSSHPNRFDTDGDGWHDLPDTRDPETNPLLGDTDSDGFGDFIDPRPRTEDNPPALEVRSVSLDRQLALKQVDDSDLASIEVNPHYSPIGAESFWGANRDKQYAFVRELGQTNDFTHGINFRRAGELPEGPDKYWVNVTDVHDNRQSFLVNLQSGSQDFTRAELAVGGFGTGTGVGTGVGFGSALIGGTVVGTAVLGATGYISVQEFSQTTETRVTRDVAVPITETVGTFPVEDSRIDEPLKLPSGFTSEITIGEIPYRKGYGWEYIQNELPGINSRDDIGDVLRLPSKITSDDKTTVIIGENGDTVYTVYDGIIIYAAEIFEEYESPNGEENDEILQERRVILTRETWDDHIKEREDHLTQDEIRNVVENADEAFKNPNTGLYMWVIHTATGLKIVRAKDLSRIEDAPEDWINIGTAYESTESLQKLRERYGLSERIYP